LSICPACQALVGRREPGPRLDLLESADPASISASSFAFCSADKLPPARDDLDLAHQPFFWSLEKDSPEKASITDRVTQCQTVQTGRLRLGSPGER
jgi:hypothetical protein